MLKKSSAISSLLGALALATILVGSTTGYLILQPLGNEPIGAGGITRVQGNARGTSTTSSIAVTLNSAPINGNVLVATIVTYAMLLRTVSSITQTGVTWAKQAGQTAYAMDVEIWFEVVGGGATTTITVNLSGDASQGAVANVCEYSGVKTSGFLDKTSSSYGESSYPKTGTTATTTQDTELWIGATNSKDTSQSTPINGFTLLDGSGSNHVSNAYLEKIVTATGTANSGTTISFAFKWVGCIATFKANRAPDAPSLSSPAANYRFNPSAPVTFSWAFSDPDAGDYQTAYQFQLADTPIFSPPLIDTGKTTSASQQTTQTLPATVHTYYWHVKTWDSYGADGSYGGLGRVIIVDRIKIVAGGINSVVDTRTGGAVWYTAVYEYDSTAFTGSVGTLSLNSTTMVWATDRWTYAFPYQMSGNQAVFQITSVAETAYGLTSVNNAAGDLVLNWATMGITITKP